jgi:DNA helicase-2/ATP-dependent DNA helicase PcrA
MFGSPSHLVHQASYLDDLNDAQRAAVTAPDGPVLVVAGAGTGKTLTLACRVAHLVDRGVPPERILLLTFTRRAAREMLIRAEHMVGHGVTGRVWGGTFHAVANRLLRAHGGALGVRPDFTVMDQADAADLMNLIRGEHGLGRGKVRFPKKDTLAAIYSRAVNAGVRLSEVLERDFPWCRDSKDGIRDIFDRYTHRKRERNVLDFDDLLLYWRALASASGVGDRVAELFDHVLVDEYQDTNALQADILAAMCRTSRNLTVVGDDAQAIYSFRSATVRNILEFPSVFDGANVITLERNYRSTPPILDVSNAVIAGSPRRHQKSLWTEREGRLRPRLVTCLDDAEQADEVCLRLLEHREEGIMLQRQAVLFRAAHHSDVLEVELARRNIPFVKYGGLRFLEAAHVKDALAVLRILENPQDEVSWFRVLQLLDGVGPAGATALMRTLGIGRDAGAAPLQRLREDPPSVPAAAGLDFERLRGTIADCGGGDEADRSDLIPPAVQVERVARFLEPVVVRRYSSPASRMRDLEQMEVLAGGFVSRGRFIADLTLDPPVSTGDLAGPPLLDEDFVILSTIHSAKGCEWDVVHVIHAADGNIPSDMATGDAEQIEEERRLLYVALTRAKDALHVYVPLRYYHRKNPLSDRHSYAQISRFLTSDVQELFERHSTHVDGESAEHRLVSAESARSVEAFVKHLWD